jgi:hypothetical protein
MNEKYTRLTDDEILRILRLSRPAVIHECYFAVNGYTGDCPCNSEHCDNTGVCLPKPIGIGRVYE